jgi:hypothetical protein
MKKFIYLFMGQGDETAQELASWENWFGDVGPNLVDGGNPLGAGRAMSSAGSKDLTHDNSAVTGYTIINAADMDEAEKLLTKCPMKNSVQIYECMPM